METSESGNQPWKVLIVDDEPEIHILTRTVLKEVQFDDRPLLFLSAYDGPGTRKILEEESDIALILMDVVMEEDDTGLELIRYIREDLGNRLTRIILRTGAPGEAPEKRIIIDYEINDYKEKIDLTTPRLFTSVIKSLRNYRDLKRLRGINSELEESRESLTGVIRTSSKLFSSQTIGGFLGELVLQAAIMLNRRGQILIFNQAEKIIVAGEAVDESLLQEILELPDGLESNSDIAVVGDYFIGRLTASNESDIFLCCDGCKSINADEMQMLEIFFSNVNIVYKNLSLKNEALSTQSEMIGLLGDIIENRSQELLGHEARVSKYAVIIARKLGFSEEDIVILRDAVRLHDTGKIGIFDSILKKPGPLSSEEFELMKNHTTIGYEILRFSSRKLFQMAAIIAWEHHERWDGKGYPRGLAGEQIHPLGRITCIVDVFDALSSERVYRKAWDFEKTIQYIKDGRDTQFDPQMVDFFLEEQDRIREILARDMD